jgi:hypothetical protein
MRANLFSTTAVLGLFALPSLGCFMLGPVRTPIQGQQVEQLTTCKNTDLGKIRKNLMLNGFSIRDATDDTIETEYKQVDDGLRAPSLAGGPFARVEGPVSKTSKRVTVIKLDDTTVKFRVRVREDSLRKVETGRVTSSTGQVIATDSSLVHDENEQDEHYFTETIPQHEETRRQICGA